MDFQQVETLWTQNGGDSGWAPLMAGIAMAESGGNTAALNNNPATGDYSVGLWQINYYNGLLAPRTAEFGSPAALLADPNKQAQAAVAIFGNNGAGIGAWKGDAAYKKWQAAGSPQKPSAQVVQSWGLTNGAASSVPPAPINAAQAGSGNGCTAKGGGVSIPLLGTIGTACQLKALTGGLLVGVGGVVMLAGGLLVAAYGLKGTQAGRSAQRSYNTLHPYRTPSGKKVQSRRTVARNVAQGQTDRRNAAEDRTQARYAAAPPKSQAEGEREGRNLANRTATQTGGNTANTAAPRPRVKVRPDPSMAKDTTGAGRHPAY